MIEPLNTGFIVYVDWGPGSLPMVLAYENSAEAAKSKSQAVLDSGDVGLGEDVRVYGPLHVDCHKERSDFDPDDWILFGHDYAPHGDVVVKHGAKPIEE